MNFLFFHVYNLKYTQTLNIYSDHNKFCILSNCLMIGYQFNLNSYQEGLKQSKVLQEKRHEEENTVEKLLELKNKDEESGKKINKSR